MSKHYAELMLYWGNCPTNGIRGEGLISLDPNNPYSVRRYQAAVENVEWYFCPSLMHFVHVGGLKGETVAKKGELEAREIIKAIKTDFQNATDVIEPTSIAHGTVGFWRKLDLMA